MVPHAFYLRVGNGQRFCLYHEPAGDKLQGGLLYLHPFAEEMNKCRRMAALTARAMSDNGYAVLQVDLHGCGDSSDDFGDATWKTWQDDAVAAYAWLHDRCKAPLWLWGLRAGCLLASEAAHRLEGQPNLLYWHPVASGKQYLQQFLRLRLAGGLQDKAAKESTEALRQQLAAGESVEIAGYSLAPGLASGLSQSELALPPESSRVIWLEVSARSEASIAPAAQKRLLEWQTAGREIHAEVISGPAFWQTSEVEVAPALLDATLTALNDASR